MILQSTCSLKTTFFKSSNFSIVSPFLCPFPLLIIYMLLTVNVTNKQRNTVFLLELACPPSIITNQTFFCWTSMAPSVDPLWKQLKVRKCDVLCPNVSLGVPVCMCVCVCVPMCVCVCVSCVFGSSSNFESKWGSVMSCVPMCPSVSQGISVWLIIVWCELAWVYTPMTLSGGKTGAH